MPPKSMTSSAPSSSPSSSPGVSSSAYEMSKLLADMPGTLKWPRSPSWSPSEASASALSSTPASELETPRARRSTANRFWENNTGHTDGNAPGIDLASDSGDPDDDSEAALAKKLSDLDQKIKRLLILETNVVRLKNLETNETVKEYEKLLDAFTLKPKTKKTRARHTDALLLFVDKHGQILELYNQFAIVDKKLRRDRVLPQFEKEGVPSDSNQRSGEDTEHKHEYVQRAPAAPSKRKHNDNEDSDPEGIVTQEFNASEEFDGPSVFNTRGLTSYTDVFNRKSDATAEKNQRRFLLYKLNDPLSLTRQRQTIISGELVPDIHGQEVDATPTRPGKKRRLN